jgi:hypothetical protein
VRLRRLLVVVGLVLVAAGVVLLIQHDVFQGSSGAGQSAGVAASETRAVAPFSAVSLVGANNVVIRVGGPQSVVVHTDAKLLDRITTQVQDDRLVIGTTPGDFTSKSTTRVDLTVPSLRYLTLDGSGVIVVSGIDTASLTVTMSGTGVIRAGGRATRLDVTLSGFGNIQLQRVIAENVYAVVSGAGRIAVTALRSLDASVPGAGTIVYGGSPPDVTKNVSGQGTITSR